MNNPDSTHDEHIRPNFQLFETMLVTRNGQARHLDLHLTRLQHSAFALDFHFDRAEALARVDAAITLAQSNDPSRLRLSLARDGAINISNAELSALPDQAVQLLIDHDALRNPRALAAHKTTLRADYDEGICRAEARGAFDTLFFANDGRLIEGGRSNVFVLIDGTWCTPPVSDGALPGIMRGLLLEDSTWRARERTLYLADILRAESLMVCNSLRGALRARIMTDA